MTDQNLDAVEYLIVDSSEDADAVPEELRRAGLPAGYHWSEPAGVYAAMNVGLGLALGEYCYFLNSGDTLHSPAVLAEVRGRLEGTKAPWAFGPVEVVSRDGTSTVTPPWDYPRERDLCFSRGHFPPHQGTFVRTELLREIGGFDPSYAIVADYAVFLRLSQVASPQILDTIVATFVEGGLSTTRWKASVREFHRARRRILQPRGSVAWRERYETTAQFLRLLLARDILRRGR
jgi:GT2 family glycosyltransferase